MKRMIAALAMAFGMFSRIPTPQVWDEKARPLMTLFLPVVGAVLGILWFALAKLAFWLALPASVAAIFLTVFPLLFAGFIHLDGFMDCCDALLSCRPLEEKQRILKDSYVGSFSVISVVLILLTFFAFFMALEDETSIAALIFIPIVSRACAGLGVSLFKPMSHSQYDHAYRSGVKKSHIFVLTAFIALSLAASTWIGSLSTLWPTLASGLFCCFAMIAARRQLGGMSGDIAGYSIVIGEVCAVAVLILV